VTIGVRLWGLGVGVRPVGAGWKVSYVLAPRPRLTKIRKTRIPSRASLSFEARKWDILHLSATPGRRSVG
jgi:hypothetical protein